ncbi:class I SAM-dependent methyltransferase [soil metagenome]
MINPSIKEYYEINLQKHGATAQGVGWKNQEAQEVRFNQLAKVIYTDTPISINDLGCGTGDLFDFLAGKFGPISYRGYDVIPEMITMAKEQHAASGAAFDLINQSGEMLKADYTIASGIFNLKFDSSGESWKDYILSTLHVMNDKSSKGFSFNALTSYSDKEMMKEELFYSDPKWLFDYCRTKFARNVALLHDYNLYDFTILVKKNF